MLGAGVRAHREGHGLLVGASEAGSGPLKTSQRGRLCAALSWKTGTVSHRKGLVVSQMAGHVLETGSSLSSGWSWGETRPQA